MKTKGSRGDRIEAGPPASYNQSKYRILFKKPCNTKSVLIRFINL